MSARCATAPSTIDCKDGENNGTHLEPIGVRSLVVHGSPCGRHAASGLCGADGDCGVLRAAGRQPSGSNDASPTVGAQHGRPVVDVHVTPEAVASKPKPPVLTTPESAVRSYLDWVSYAYRIGVSDVAHAHDDHPRRGPGRLLHPVQPPEEPAYRPDARRRSPSASRASRRASAVVPAKEKWTYRYVSIKAPAARPSAVRTPRAMTRPTRWCGRARGTGWSTR